MTHVYSVKTIRSLIRDLESSSVSSNITAFGRLVLFFGTKGAWDSMPAETQNDLKQHILRFLEEPPVADPGGTFTIRGLPLQLVLKTAEMVPDDEVNDRLDMLRQSNDESLRQAVLAILGISAAEDYRLEEQRIEEQRIEEQRIEERSREQATPARRAPREESASGETHLESGSVGFFRMGDSSMADILATGSEENEEKAKGTGEAPDGEKQPPHSERTQKLFLKTLQEKFPEDPRSLTRVYTRSGMGGSAGGSSGAGTAAPLEVVPVLEKKEATISEAAPAQEPQRYVNTGFVPGTNPDCPVSPTVPLKTNTKYYFIVNIGKIEKWSGELDPGKSKVPAGQETEFQVAIFSPDNGIMIRGSGDIGAVKVTGEGAEVTQQPGKKINDVPESSHKLEWLFFPITTPTTENQYEMHCIIYLKQVPIQVRRITVQVTTNPEDWPPFTRAWRSDLIFSLSDSLLPAILNQVHEHQASIFFDVDARDTSRLFIFGSEPNLVFIKEDISIGVMALQESITEARNRLIKATISYDQQGKTQYNYENLKSSRAAFPSGLLLLAEWGYVFYSQIMALIPKDKKDALSHLLQTTSYIHISMKDSTQNFFPAAMIYDFPLRNGLKEYRMCAQFWKYLEEGEDLGSINCYGDQCTARNDASKTTLCPMGFWGFRHILGIPLSLKGDIQSQIPIEDMLKVVIATAESLDTSGAHFSDMAARIKTNSSRLCPQVTINPKPATDVDELRGQLNQSPHIIYFYCHGICKPQGIPVLECGPEQNPFEIDPSYFNDITSWEKTHPLVFINGCHTGDVMPEEFLEFITPLIVQQKASGVIGTEIPIYNSMAACFAEACLSSFVGGKTIGESVRDGRLAVLSTYNPLGLVYSPFISGGVKLEKS
jgi:cell division protein ZapA (FtsZ GTPase activity inhibitor)